MNKIDEITLRVGCELWGEFHPRVTDYNEVKQLTRFANALLAELSKDAEPVAFTNSCELEYLDFKRADGGLVIGAMWKEWDEDADIPLFTSPPNTADVERRVAEACATLCGTRAQQTTFSWFRRDEAQACEAEILSGKWREYW